jgi:hypothetical protein
MDEPQRLRELAAWYREFAERAGNPWIWEARLKQADDLEQEAAHLEARPTGGAGHPALPKRNGG